MPFPELSVFVEAVGACLLVAVIVYAIRLNRLLGQLKADKGELERLVSSFDKSTHRAEQNVQKLKASAAETATALQANVAKAEKLREELAFMIDRADESADRLEAAISGARKMRSSDGRAVPVATSGGGRGREVAVAAGSDAGQRQGGPVAMRRGEDDGAARKRKTKSDLLKALEGMR